MLSHLFHLVLFTLTVRCCFVGQPGKKAAEEKKTEMAGEQNKVLKSFGVCCVGLASMNRHANKNLRWSNDEKSQEKISCFNKYIRTQFSNLRVAKRAEKISQNDGVFFFRSSRMTIIETFQFQFQIAQRRRDVGTKYFYFSWILIFPILNEFSVFCWLFSDKPNDFVHQS